MGVAGADGGKEGEVVAEVHRLAAVLRYRGSTVRGGGSAYQRAAGSLRTSSIRQKHWHQQNKRYQAVQAVHACSTSLPMAMYWMAQGSGWPIEARRDPHLLQAGQAGQGAGATCGAGRGGQAGQADTE